MAIADHSPGHMNEGAMASEWEKPQSQLPFITRHKFTFFCTRHSTLLTFHHHFVSQLATSCCYGVTSSSHKQSEGERSIKNMQIIIPQWIVMNISEKGISICYTMWATAWILIIIITIYGWYSNVKFLVNKLFTTYLPPLSSTREVLSFIWTAVLATVL